MQHVGRSLRGAAQLAPYPGEALRVGLWSGSLAFASGPVFCHLVLAFQGLSRIKSFLDLFHGGALVFTFGNLIGDELFECRAVGGRPVAFVILIRDSLRVGDAGVLPKRSSSICSPDTYSCERGGLEPRAVEGGALELRAVEGGALEMRLVERGALEMHADEGGALKPRAYERGAQESRIEKRGALELRVVEQGAPELHLLERRTLELREVERGALELCAVERGVMELRSVERGALKPRVFERGALELSAG
jgi:hypothetical protein